MQSLEDRNNLEKQNSANRIDSGDLPPGRELADTQQAKLRAILSAIDLQRQTPESKAPRIEATKSASKVVQLEAQQQSAKSEKLVADRARNVDRKNWLFVAAAIAFAAVLTAAVMISRQVIVAKDVVNAPPYADTVVTQVSSPATANSAETQGSSVVLSQAPQQALPSKITQQGFSQSLARLSRALESTPQRRPEDILKDVHLKSGNSVCAFEWNGGQPAMLFPAGSSANSLSEAISQCAQAVEKYR